MHRYTGRRLANLKRQVCARLEIQQQQQQKQHDNNSVDNTNLASRLTQVILIILTHYDMKLH